MTRHLSGSPSAWKLRRQAYQKTSGPVSNPNRPSPTNRKARREEKRNLPVLTRDILEFP